MKLNDWGYLVLLYNTAKNIYPDSPDSRHMFVWFMLNKSLYKAKIGAVDDKLLLFLPVKNKLFGIPFFTQESSGSRLYVLDMDNLLSPIEGSIYTYDQDYGPADKILDMSMKVLPEIGKRGGKRNISFSYEGVNHNIKVIYNQNRINFLRNYPYTDLKIYFNSTVNTELNSALLDSFKGILEGKNELEKTNIILRFVQTATGYKTDPENFGSEKPLFVEESLYYPFSDCEDRSILFAYLIKILVGLDVIGLDYPGHIATAVKFENPTPGYSISYKGSNYLICDPTYIGARAGVCMPDLKETPPDALIEIL